LYVVFNAMHKNEVQLCDVPKISYTFKTTIETCWAHLGDNYNNGPSILVDINWQEDNVELVRPCNFFKKAILVSMIKDSYYK
jgi:hypothetical protein